MHEVEIEADHKNLRMREVVVETNRVSECGSRIAAENLDNVTAMSGNISVEAAVPVVRRTGKPLSE